MRVVGHGSVAFPAAQNDACRQSGNTGADMNDVAAGEVNGTDHLQQSAAPCHMCQRVIYQERPDHHEQYHFGKFHAFCHGSQNDCRRDHCEHHVEQSRHHFRCIALSAGNFPRNIPHQHIVQVADDAGMILAEAQRIAAEKPQQHTDSHHCHAKHHGVQGIFPSYHAAVKECQPRCHKEYHNGTYEHECNIACHDATPLFFYENTASRLRAKPSDGLYAVFPFYTPVSRDYGNSPLMSSAYSSRRSATI